MKTLKKGLLFLGVMLLACNIAYSQDDQPTMYLVHTDHVKFEKTPQYEQLAKSLKDNCVKHEMKDINWITISVEDGRYVHVSPITSMADLDKNPMASLAEKMGAEAMGKMFSDMDECYDSHSNKIVHYIPELSYKGSSDSDQGNYREYHFLYYAPRNGKAMKEAMAKVKELFKTKNAKHGYDVFHSGFGSDENYYMVVISGEDDIEIATEGKENRDSLGEERGATFFNVIKLATRYDQVEGEIRPDLSYTPN